MQHLSIPEWFRRLALVQVATALVGVVVWFWMRTEAFLAGPPSPDLYANNWGFQLVVFLLVWLPAAALAAIAILAMELLALLVVQWARKSLNAP